MKLILDSSTEEFLFNFYKNNRCEDNFLNKLKELIDELNKKIKNDLTITISINESKKSKKKLKSIIVIEKKDLILNNAILDFILWLTEKFDDNDIRMFLELMY